ncbi:unnamed protein product [Victoria cruziana]
MPRVFSPSARCRDRFLYIVASSRLQLQSASRCRECTESSPEIPSVHRLRLSPALCPFRWYLYKRACRLAHFSRLRASVLIGGIINKLLLILLNASRCSSLSTVF